MNNKRSRKPEEELKAESQKRKAVKKSEVGSPKSEEDNNSAPDSYRDDLPQSEINKSDLIKSEIENPKWKYTITPK